MVSGGQLAGGNSTYGRVDDDFYATNPISLQLRGSSRNTVKICLCVFNKASSIK